MPRGEHFTPVSSYLPQGPPEQSTAKLLPSTTAEICAIRAIDPDVADRFLENVIPMKGRMIHDEFGRQQSQLYDRDGQVCNFMFSCSSFLTLPSLLHLYFRVSVFTHAPFEL